MATFPANCEFPARVVAIDVGGTKITGSIVRYDPSISVLHYQYVASKMEYRSIVRRSKFVIDCLLDSLDAAEALILASDASEPEGAQPVNTIALADA